MLFRSDSRNDKLKEGVWHTVCKELRKTNPQLIPKLPEKEVVQPKKQPQKQSQSKSNKKK